MQLDGDMIRDARKALGLTQQEVAAKLSMSRTTISQIERSTINEIGFRKISRLCFLLGLELLIQPKRRLPQLEEAYAISKAQRDEDLRQTDAVLAAAFRKK